VAAGKKVYVLDFSEKILVFSNKVKLTIAIEDITGVSYEDLELKYIEKENRFKVRNKLDHKAKKFQHLYVIETKLL